jgi:hypothetical protein
MDDEGEADDEGEYGVFDDFEPGSSDVPVDAVEEHDTWGIDEDVRAKDED